MRTLHTDAALVAIPGLLSAAVSGLIGYALVSVAVSLTGDWFTLSMIFSPVYFILGLVLGERGLRFSERRISYGTISIRTGLHVVTACGALTAIIGLAEPSIFVAIAVSCAGVTLALKAPLYDEDRFGALRDETRHRKFSIGRAERHQT